jgi:hypothetical protein
LTRQEFACAETPVYRSNGDGRYELPFILPDRLLQPPARPAKTLPPPSPSSPPPAIKSKKRSKSDDDEGDEPQLKRLRTENGAASKGTEKPATEDQDFTEVDGVLVLDEDADDEDGDIIVVE